MTIRLKNPREVQRAHDILTVVVLKELPLQLDGGEDALQCLHSALDALCWVLGHDHNSAFADNLKDIEATLAEKGFVLSEIQ